MTKDEALKLALKFVEDSECGTADLEAHIKEALAQPEQKPVPVKRMMGWVEGLKRQSDNGRYMHIPSGLNSGTCWELANELEQFINTTPSQRTWVGLTKEERHEISMANRPYCADIMAAHEEELKRRNT